MADIPSVTPPAPPSPVSGNSALQANIPNAAVAKAPPALTAPPQPVEVSGTVISSNPQAQKLSIQTPQGEIVVQTSAALPTDTPVLLEIFTSNAQTRATVSVVRQGASDAQAQAREATAQGLQTLENAITTPATQQQSAPPLQEGSILAALQLPAATSAPSQIPASSVPLPAAPTQETITPLQIDQLAAAIEGLKKTGQQDILKTRAPARLLDAFLKTADLKPLLERLPPQTQQSLAEAFLSAPQTPAEKPADILQQIISTYMPPEAGKQNAASAPPNAQSEPAPEAFDHNLLHIARAQLLARATQENLQTSSAPGDNKPEKFLPLASTLDMLATALGEETPSGVTALMRQLMPQDLQARLPLPQNMFRIHILKILPPETTSAQTQTALQEARAGQPATQTAQHIKLQIATVETLASGGKPILQTTGGEHFVLTTPAAVPLGSKIILTATPMAAKDILQSIQTGLAAAPNGAIIPQKEGWPALQQALQALSSTQGEQTTAITSAATAAMTTAATAAGQILHNSLPTPTQRLVPTALFFLAALRSGDIKNWLGENTLRAIEKIAAKGLSDALSSDFGKMSAQAKTTLPGGWRVLSIPLRHEEQISQMQFYVRRQEDREQKSEISGPSKPATRFILNMTFSRLGPLQLDGYVHKKSFDMVMRTEDSLPLDMRQELMKRFASGLAQVDMQGGIAFQTRRQGWMVPEVAHTKTDA